MDLLSENVLYIIESLKYSEDYCSAVTKLENLNEITNKILFDKVVDQLIVAIRICLNSYSNESSYFNENEIKYEIFTYLFARYFDIKNISFLNGNKIPKLSSELIIELAIMNRLEDIIEVKLFLEILKSEAENILN